jgi:hypothetical protein
VSIPFGVGGWPREDFVLVLVVVLEFGLWRGLIPGAVRFEKRIRAVDYRNPFTAWLAFRKHITGDPTALSRTRTTTRTSTSGSKRQTLPELLDLLKHPFGDFANLAGSQKREMKKFQQQETLRGKK